MRRHFRDRKDQKRHGRYVTKQNYAGMHRLSSVTRHTRPPSLPRQTRPSDPQTSLRLPRLLTPLRLRRHRESVIPTDHKVPKMSTDEKVLGGIWAAFLLGVVYSLWIIVQLT